MKSCSRISLSQPEPPVAEIVSPMLNNPSTSWADRMKIVELLVKSDTPADKEALKIYITREKDFEIQNVITKYLKKG
jgi:hypothetical protein